MTNNMGRDQFWTDGDAWSQIDQAVQKEVGSVRVAQRVIPTVMLDGAQNVAADVTDIRTMTIEEGQTKPFVELSIEFTLTEAQIENETTLRTAQKLARLGAKSLALAEDILLLQGAGPFENARLQGNGGAAARSDGNHPAFLAQIRVINGAAAGDGILGTIPRDHIIPVPPLDPSGSSQLGPRYGGNTFEKVVQGIATLTGQGQPGPYALILESSVYADTYSPLPETLVTVADRITPLLPGGFYATGALPVRTGLLLSLGGEPTSLYMSKLGSQDVMTAFTQQDQDGNYRFRVFERVQFVVRDPDALVGFTFLPVSQLEREMDKGRTAQREAVQATS